MIVLKMKKIRKIIKEKINDCSTHLSLSTQKLLFHVKLI
ncbi:hypothetical protein RV14_GL000689 [Enterococcus ratti]|uniref:Uncharacterized protein n=1 Tax=Enterococcus ratti TaxID=150033 RepID=A0A1L8WG71_9ENTE|nr:hypothetical protein RV14_GL000689 [Enterococcus ratti]